MRKLVFILIAFLAVATFLRAFADTDRVETPGSASEIGETY